MAGDLRFPASTTLSLLLLRFGSASGPDPHTRAHIRWDRTGRRSSGDLERNSLEVPAGGSVVTRARVNQIPGASASYDRVRGCMIVHAGTAGCVQMHPGFSCVEDSVARDYVTAGADIDRVADGCAEDLVAGNGHSVSGGARSVGEELDTL